MMFLQGWRVSNLSSLCLIIHMVALRAHYLQISPVSAINLTWSTWKSACYPQMLRQLSSVMQGWCICNLSGWLMIFLVVSKVHYLQISHCQKWIWQERLPATDRCSNLVLWCRSSWVDGFANLVDEWWCFLVIFRADNSQICQSQGWVWREKCLLPTDAATQSCDDVLRLTHFAILGDEWSCSSLYWEFLVSPMNPALAVDKCSNLVVWWRY